MRLPAVWVILHRFIDLPHHTLTIAHLFVVVVVVVTVVVAAVGAVVAASLIFLGVTRLEDDPLEDVPLEDALLQMANSHQLIRTIHNLLTEEEGRPIPTKTILAGVIIRVITKDLQILQTTSIPTQINPVRFLHLAQALLAPQFLQTTIHLGTKPLSPSFRFLESIAACILSFLITLGPS